jgi:hypothetical protein
MTNILCGPLLRRVEQQRLVIWLVTQAQDISALHLSIGSEKYSLTPQRHWQHIQIGTHAWVHLLDCALDFKLPENEFIEYDIAFVNGDLLSNILPQLSYDHSPTNRPNFVYREKVTSLFHGSCRNPHHASFDALIAANDQQQTALTPEHRANFIVMSGDQIYADDVAGPTLMAIQQLINLLGLFEEQPLDESELEGSELLTNTSLQQHKYNLYQRKALLPKVTDKQTSITGLFATERDIFSSTFADNHLITMAEYFALYLLVWSPNAWGLLENTQNKWQALPSDLSVEHQKKWHSELSSIEHFRLGLPSVSQLLAHTPSYMMFDDHDVTDDWNLTAAWQTAAYSNTQSKRIIGNALIAYALFQGLGNQPDSFGGEGLNDDGNTSVINIRDLSKQSVLIETILAFEGWSYHVACSPKMVVLDSRTQRWQSEVSPYRPNGLMDWEALSDLQHQIQGEDSIILVAPAPIFGVKFIETIQRIFTFFNQPLLVDAENWMAHEGTAMALLQMFKHRNTPQNFIILSGDVHYSFVAEIDIRFRKESPKIWQITSSGIKNQFKPGLLTVFDFLNRLLFASQSPLNIFTKRKRMKVVEHTPVVLGAEHSHKKNHRHLHNATGIGYLHLDDAGKPSKIEELGEQTTVFYQKNELKGKKRK